VAIEARPTAATRVGSTLAVTVRCRIMLGYYKRTTACRALFARCLTQ